MIRASLGLDRPSTVPASRPRRDARGERALEVDLDDEVPLVLGHVGEHAVAQDAGVVDDDVEPAEGLDGLVDHLLRGREVAHVGAVDRRFAAHRLDLVDHLLGRAGVGSLCRRGRAPRSFTITLAPCSASISAYSRPMPRPAPVTTATRPSHMPVTAGSPWLCTRSSQLLVVRTKVAGGRPTAAAVMGRPGSPLLLWARAWCDWGSRCQFGGRSTGLTTAPLRDACSARLMSWSGKVSMSRSKGNRPSCDREMRCGITT